MDNMPLRGSNSAANGGHRKEERSFLDDALPNIEEPVRRPVKHGSNSSHSEEKSNKLKMIICGAVAAVVLLIIAIGGAMWLMHPSASALVGIDKSKFQAVFFTNGQVYFGKLEAQNADYMKLTDIFYLQTQNSDNQSKDSKNPQSTSTSDQPNVQLIKLGNEIHGPNDEMIISKNQVLFFENLKSEGKVAQTISKYEATGGK